VPGTFQLGVRPSIRACGARRGRQSTSLRLGRHAMITLKRAYDPVSDTDGTRLLVERLWPRGVSKAKLRVDA